MPQEATGIGNLRDNVQAICAEFTNTHKTTTNDDGTFYSSSFWKPGTELPSNFNGAVLPPSYNHAEYYLWKAEASPKYNILRQEW